MDLLRSDLISLFDLRFERVGRIPWPRVEDSGSPAASRLQESFGWIFYGEQIEGFELYDLSGAVPDLAGAALRINRRSRVGTFLTWRTYRGPSDPRALKSEVWTQSGDALAPIDAYFSNLHNDRIYPFVAIQADTDPEELDAFASAHAVELGRILTGDLEGERPATLKQYVDSDLSKRAYEKLFLRWTEALALYARLHSEEFYEECMFRAVQIFEHCILGQVSLVSVLERLDHFSRRLLLVTPRKWFRARDLFTALAEAETTFVVYPKTQSVEADRLLTAAHNQFGLPSFLSSAKAKGVEVREQFEWAKTQSLALIAVLTYLLDKIVGWDNIKHWFAALVHHH